MTTQTQTAEIKPPREGTKQAKLVAMLSRKSGVTLAKASESLGWLPHTTSATMTGLRKRGYAITRTERPHKDSLYVILPGEVDA
jgi:predicted ArsR family transcriptional regulator